MARASRTTGIWLWMGMDGGIRYEPLLLTREIDIVILLILRILLDCIAFARDVSLVAIFVL